MKSIRILVTSFLCLLVFPAFAQDEFVIEGSVSDAETDTTLPFANVFVANTTFGTASDDEGNFRLVLPGSGTYDLIISFSGYETFARSVRFVVPSIVTIEAKLVTKSRQLKGAVVKAEKDEVWKRRLAQFKAGFLGTSLNAKSSKIVNEEVLNFHYDDETGTFEAFAYEPLVIENKELGYRLKYLLEDFRSNHRQGYSSFLGFTVFEELKSKKSPKKYLKERNKAYLGSLQHFFSTLYKGTTKEEGYEIYHAADLEGMGRVIDKNQIEIDSVVFEGKDSQTKKLVFRDMMFVYYKNERVPAEYYGSRGGGIVIRRPADDSSQHSWIRMREDETEVHFESNGYIVNPLSFFSFGIWSYEKVGDMMPINYEVQSTRQNSRRKR